MHPGRGRCSWRGSLVGGVVFTLRERIARLPSRERSGHDRTEDRRGRHRSQRCGDRRRPDRAGHDVTFIEQWPAHVEAMRARRDPGRDCPDESRRRPRRSRALHLCDVATLRGERFDLVFVRGQGLRHPLGVRADQAASSRRTALVVGLQNGMTVDDIADVIGPSAPSAPSSRSLPTCSSPASSTGTVRRRALLVRGRRPRPGRARAGASEVAEVLAARRHRRGRPTTSARRSG